MKPNEKQIKVCDLLIMQINIWKTSNDIKSPSHYTLIDNLGMDFINNEVDAKDITDLLKNTESLFNDIKHLK